VYASKRPAVMAAIHKTRDHFASALPLASINASLCPSSPKTRVYVFCITVTARAMQISFKIKDRVREGFVG